MSSSIAIPKRKQAAVRNSLSSSSTSSSSSSSYSSLHHIGSSMHSPQTPSTCFPASASKSKGKQKVVESPTPERISARRPSMMGSSISESSYTVINFGHEDGPPRLVTCVKSSQGFDWNQELFLPSYADYDSLEFEHRPDPVEEIRLTDEEAAAIMPR